MDTLQECPFMVRTKGFRYTNAHDAKLCGLFVVNVNQFEQKIGLP